MGMGNFWLPPTPMRISQRWELGLGLLSKIPLFSGWQLPPLRCRPHAASPSQATDLLPLRPPVGGISAEVCCFCLEARQGLSLPGPAGLAPCPEAAEFMWEEWRSEFSPQSRGALKRVPVGVFRT